MDKMPKWALIISRVLREFECYDAEVFEEAGGFEAYAQLRHAAKRAQVTSAELHCPRCKAIIDVHIEQTPRP